MPRPPRKEFAGALYHVTTRGNERNCIFFSDADRERFLEQLQHCLEADEVVLYAYVLMDNHYHLLVRTIHPNLSRFMQRLNTSYALYSRYKHKKPGHRLEGRYRAKLVQGDEYIQTLTRYIHLNPVKIKSMEKVDKSQRRRYLESYPWSSYKGYVAERYQEDFVCYDVLRFFAPNPQQAQRRYRTYVLACLMKADDELRRALELSNHAIGDEEYVESVHKEMRQRKSGGPQDRDVAYPEEWISVERIEDLVVQEYGVSVDMLQAHGRKAGVGDAKGMVIELACRLSGLSQREIGMRYGGISSQAVSATRKRVKGAVAVKQMDRLVAILRNAK